jgi:hypothetical protein
MATTLGPDMPVEASPPDGLVDSHSTRHLPVPGAIDSLMSLQLGGPSPQPSPRCHPPPPNPPFVFPARPSPSSAPSSYSRATGRRPRTAAESQETTSGESSDSESRPLRSPALPAFSFNPGANLAPPEHAFLSPPQSPQSPRAIPIKPSGAGHRRGGSEFVGGNIRAGDPISVMSTSPTKSESGFPVASPNLKPTNPTGRRGHAHRRSAAISSHDLSMILKPSASSPPLRGSSAPSSPADFERRDHYAFPDPRDLQKTEEKTPEKVEDKSEPTTPLAESPPADVQEEPKETPKAIPRARVAFSDHLDYIPRPLSLVSSDTSSTMTVRPGHSVSGSISSLISLSNTTAPERETASPLARSPSRSITESRPSTAGAVLERSESISKGGITGASPRRRNSIPLLTAVPTNNLGSPPLPSPSRTPKRWSFFGIEPFVGASSPTRSRPASASSNDSGSKITASADSSTDHVPSCPEKVPEEPVAPMKRVARRSSKNKKKVKSWAGSILTRNSKPRRKSRRVTTPTPPQDPEPEEEVAEELASPTSESTTPTLVVTESDAPTDSVSQWQPRPMAPQDDDPSFPMIDLDAALGPFNTPLPRNAEWEAAQKGAGLTNVSSKRPLHSAAGMSRFTGPGMHYSAHRRAESAPEMPPFQRAAGIPRYNSNSTMADVFEEDEEDEESGKDGSDTTPTATAETPDEQTAQRTSIDIRVTDQYDLVAGRPHEVSDDATSSVALSRRGSGLSGISDDDRTQPSLGLKSEYSASSLHEDVIIEETSDFAFGPADGGCNIVDPTDSTTPSPRRLLKGKDLAPVDVSPLHLPTVSLAPVSPYSMSHSSVFPSPRSPMSYDGNRVSTAPSSVTEDHFQSLLLGEPGPEVRISSDIPSLTSSNSTMTRESGFVQSAHQRNLPPFSSERPASFTATAFGRRRSSLASLQRLISTSHGERSKLSMEVSAESEPLKKAKTSKTKRLSRLMQFWKPKEGSSTPPRPATSGILGK